VHRAKVILKLSLRLLQAVKVTDEEFTDLYAP
jgi:hypothetical protein